MSRQIEAKLLLSHENSTNHQNMAHYGHIGLFFLICKYDMYIVIWINYYLEPFFLSLVSLWASFLEGETAQDIEEKAV